MNAGCAVHRLAVPVQPVCSFSGVAFCLLEISGHLLEQVREANQLIRQRGFVRIDLALGGRWDERKKLVSRGFLTVDRETFWLAGFTDEDVRVESEQVWIADYAQLVRWTRDGSEELPASVVVRDGLAFWIPDRFQDFSGSRERFLEDMAREVRMFMAASVS